MKTILSRTGMLTSTELTSIMKTLRGIEDSMELKEGLTGRQRQLLKQMGRQNHLLIQDVLLTMRAFPELVPPMVDKVEVERLYEHYKRQQEILHFLMNLTRKMKDNSMEIANEVIGKTLAFYKFSKIMLKLGESGLQPYVDSMKARFDHSQLTEYDLEENDIIPNLLEEDLSKEEFAKKGVEEEEVEKRDTPEIV